MVGIAAPVDGAQLLGGDPGRGDLTALVTGLDAGEQPRPRGVGEVLGTAAQHAANAVQQVAAAASMPEGLLPDMAAHVIDGSQSSRMTWNGSTTRTACGRPVDRADP